MEYGRSQRTVSIASLHERGMSGLSSHRARLSRGFTLLELLVALFISALMFAFGYAALTQVTNQREGVARAQVELAELRTALRILGNDLTQQIARPIRDPSGTTLLPALGAEGRDGVVFSLTRGAAGLPGVASPLRRIDYRLENGALVRDSWPVLDRTAQGTPTRRIILTETESVSVRYLATPSDWRSDWVPEDARDLPLAVEVTLVTRRYGRISRLLEVP